MSKPTRQPDDLDATRDEVTRALLGPDHNEANELGRNRADTRTDDETPHASPREQAAAPINVLKVDE
jgi:hypothetical protein